MLCVHARVAWTSADTNAGCRPHAGVLLYVCMAVGCVGMKM